MFIKVGFLLQAAKLTICHQKSPYGETILKKSDLIRAGNFKLSCTIKTGKQVECFSPESILTLLLP